MNHNNKQTWGFGKVVVTLSKSMVRDTKNYENKNWSI